jgi:hypothetical protein
MVITIVVLLIRIDLGILVLAFRIRVCNVDTVLALGMLVGVSMWLRAWAAGIAMSMHIININIGKYSLVAGWFVDVQVAVQDANDGIRVMIMVTIQSGTIDIGVGAAPVAN